MLMVLHLNLIWNTTQSENGLYVRLNRVVQDTSTFQKLITKTKKLFPKQRSTNGTFVNIISVSGNGEKVPDLIILLEMDVLHNLKQKFHYTTKLDYICNSRWVKQKVY